MDIRKQGVIRSESGIIDKKGIYFHNASSQRLFLRSAIFILRAVGSRIYMYCSVSGMPQGA